MALYLFVSLSLMESVFLEHPSKESNRTTVPSAVKTTVFIPVIPHKAVAEVSKIGNL